MSLDNKISDETRLKHVEDAILHAQMIFEAMNWQFYISKQAHEWYIAQCARLNHKPITKYEVFDLEPQTQIEPNIPENKENSSPVIDDYEHGGGD